MQGLEFRAYVGDLYSQGRAHFLDLCKSSTLEGYTVWGLGRNVKSLHYKGFQTTTLLRVKG